MKKGYESYIGKISPGYFKPLSRDLKNRVREIENNKRLERCWAKLTIAHPSLSTAAITDILGLQPDDTLDTNQIVYQNRATVVWADQNFWSISSEHKSTGLSLQEHVQTVLNQVFGILPRIRQLQESGANLRLKLRCQNKDPVMIVDLSTEQIQRIAQLHCSLDIVFTDRND